MLVDRFLTIEFPNKDYDTITGGNIVAETMTLTRSVCDDNFKLGGCISAKFEIQLTGIPPDALTGKRIQVYLYTKSTTGTIIFPNKSLLPGLAVWPGQNTTATVGAPIFTGTIDSAVRQDNRQIVQVTAYDDLYTVGAINVYTWYSQMAHYNPDVNIRSFLDSLIGILGLTTLGIYGTVNTESKLSLSQPFIKNNCKNNVRASEILRSANELMCCWGYCDGWGRYTVKQLSNTPTFKAVTDYKTLKFEEYVTAVFDTLVLCYGDKNSYKRGRVTAEDSSCYYVDDNVILNCCTDYGTVATIGATMSETGKVLYNLPQYRPFELEIDDINYNVGDWVEVKTGYSDVPLCKGYVMSQTITGPLALMSKYSAGGDRIQQGKDRDAE